MFKIFRNERYLNTNYVSDGVKGYGLEAIRLHDGEKVLISERWLTDEYGSNSSLDYGYEKGLTIESDLILKRSIDLSLNAFIIKETLNTYSSDKGYVLYLHVSVFKELKHKQEINEGLGWLYNIYYNDDVYFKNMIQNLRKESKAVEHSIYEKIKEIKDNQYSIKKLEPLANNLKRLIKKYDSVYAKETKDIQALKETLNKW